MRLICGRRPGLRSGRHRARCLRCQASEARVRAATRALRALAIEVVPAPPGLPGAVMDRIGPQDGRAPRRDLIRRMVGRYAAGGVAAATAAAVATGVVRWRLRPLA